MSGLLADMVNKEESVFLQKEEGKKLALDRRNLTEGKVNEEYMIREIRTDDKELENFLFSLGCYEGEKITIISALSEMYVLNLKDARYSINRELAEAIII
ncbi:MAG: ferrous iron transport protein A [Spirochaetales bacterium]|nr:ferrous iron transport protein A [Spirochaetales bacterium]